MLIVEAYVHLGPLGSLLARTMEGQLKKKLVLLGAVVILILAGLTAIVVLPIVSELRSAQASLAAPAADINAQSVERAKQHLEAAARRLGSFPSRLLRIVPLIGANLDALDTIASDLPEVLDVGLGLKERLEHVEEKGLLNGNRVDLAALTSLEAPLEQQATALSRLSKKLKEHRSGLLLPRIWRSVDDLAHEIDGLENSVDDARSFLRIAPALLGADGSRTYLMMLMNNAELRGAGGILAGIGTMSVNDGRIRLGRFESVHDLQRFPPRTVPAPREYESRYSVYQANTTLWLNATYSPHLPDVGLVAARLYEKVTGKATDGAFALDPRGVAALLPPDREIPINGGLTVDVGELARFVYSDAYERFGDQSVRRDILVETGRRALQLLLEEGLSAEQRKATGAAISGGHTGFVSFDPEEALVLEELDVSNTLEEPRDDVVRVVVQNMGGGDGYGSKLDYWISRVVKHACDLTGAKAVCATEVELENEVPHGLTRYVAGRPYGLARNYVESYIPAGARLVEVTLNGRDAEVRLEEQSGQLSAGVYTEIPPGETASIFVHYEVPFDQRSFTIEMIPQPLARDARFSLDAEVPPGWQLRGPGTLREDVLELTGELDRTLNIELSQPDAPGLTGWWEGLTRFWNEPIFGG